MKDSSIVKGSSIMMDSSSKKTVMFFGIPAEGREVSIVILHGRKLNSKRQLSNKRHLDDKEQLNNKDSSSKKVVMFLLEARPKAGKFA